MEQLILNILRTTWPNRNAMAYLVDRECSKALIEVGKIDGYYLLSKTLSDSFLATAGITAEQVREFASFMPGGFVASNPFYNMLLIYILTFCASGEVDTIVYRISRYYAAITVSYAKKKYFPILNANLLYYTLINAHASTVAKQGWNALIIKIADETLLKYIEIFKTKVSLNAYYRYIVDVHNKVNQSMKHIAHKYYSNVGKVITDDITKKLSLAIENIDKVTNSPEAIEYIANMSNVNEIQVENICFKLKEYQDRDSTLQNIILRFLRQYKDRDGINKIGLSMAAGRGLVMTEIPELSAKTIKDIGMIPDKDNIKVVILIALLCIMYIDQ